MASSNKSNRAASTARDFNNTLSSIPAFEAMRFTANYARIAQVSPPSTSPNRSQHLTETRRNFKIVSTKSLWSLSKKQPVYCQIPSLSGQLRRKRLI